MAVLDGASGNNSVSAAGDTAASKGKSLTWFTGAGTDTFTGGFENDTVRVTAAAVGGDTLTGGSGANQVQMTTAGTLSLGGVSKFGIIYLATGNSTVTLTDKTLSGGAVGLHHGASGNNSVSAAGDTSASTGKALTYYAGTGTDHFTGGFENDTVDVSAAAVGGDTLTGGSGVNQLALTTSGAANLGVVSKFGIIYLATGGNTVTLTDKTLSGGAVALHDAASGNNSVSAAGDVRRASIGKTLTYYTGTKIDSFTGGFENDTVQVTAAAISGDTLIGGSGGNTLVLTTSRDLQPRRGQQVRHDQPCWRDQHGNAHRHDAVRRVGLGAQFGRQQQRQRGGRHECQHRQDADLLRRDGDGHVHRRVRERYDRCGQRGAQRGRRVHRRQRHQHAGAVRRRQFLSRCTDDTREHPDGGCGRGTGGRRRRAERGADRRSARRAEPDGQCPRCRGHPIRWIRTPRPSPSTARRTTT